MCEKVGKSRNTMFFRWFVALEGRKVGSLKRRVRSQLARGEMKNCTPLWREAHFQVKMYKTPGARRTFGSWDVEKVHAVVARSTSWSQNVQNTPAPDHFGSWDVEKVHAIVARSTFRSQNVRNTRGCGPLLAVEMSKKCTPLWREAHFQVKIYKTLGVRTTFGGWDVENVHAIVARSAFRSQNVQNTRVADHFWRLRCRKSARRCGAKHISKSKCTKHYGFGRCWKSARSCGAKHISKSKCTKHTTFGPLLEVEMSQKCTPLWREAYFQVKSAKKLTGTEHFWTFRCAFAWQAQGIVHLGKSEQNVRVL